MQQTSPCLANRPRLGGWGSTSRILANKVFTPLPARKRPDPLGRGTRNRRWSQGFLLARPSSPPVLLAAGGFFNDKKQICISCSIVAMAIFAGGVLVGQRSGGPVGSAEGHAGRKFSKPASGAARHWPGMEFRDPGRKSLSKQCQGHRRYQYGREISQSWQTTGSFRQPKTKTAARLKSGQCRHTWAVRPPPRAAQACHPRMSHSLLLSRHGGSTNRRTMNPTLPVLSFQPVHWYT